MSAGVLHKFFMCVVQCLIHIKKKRFFVCFLSTLYQTRYYSPTEMNKQHAKGSRETESYNNTNTTKQNKKEIILVYSQSYDRFASVIMNIHTHTHQIL